MRESVVILAGGGPAPGINTVISTVAKVFLKSGYRVIGLNEGFKNLFADNPTLMEFDFILADSIQKLGGSAIQMSRYKPKDAEFKTDFFTKHNVKLLVTIGGDDTASTANRITNFLVNNNIKIQNIHVPKTIDNDLPLPEGTPTFGYYSAKDEGVRITQTVYEDARTSGNWFVMSAMGREAGHLAFSIGASCHLPMIIIPEMFQNVKISFERIIRLIISSMVKRKILGIKYGVVIISEGVFHFMTDEEIVSSGIDFTFDEHGHPELGNVSKAHIFNMLVQHKLKELNITIKSRPVEIGYELRCVNPSSFDLMYCGFLGYGVKELFDQGVTGAMVTANALGVVSPLYLNDLTDENGIITPRLVNIESEKTKSVFRNGLQFIGPEDYVAAKQFLPHPEEYDFYRILNW